MTWLGWLILAAVITAFAAVTGIKPKGTEHLSHTRMMGMARLALFVVVLILLYLAFRARAHG
jgi:choline-glycine betaine transporter